MSNVIALTGETVPGAPNDDIIQELEALLRRAKSGELIGLAYCTIGAQTKGTGWSGNAGTRESIGTAIMMLHHRYAADMLGWNSK